MLRFEKTKLFIKEKKGMGGWDGKGGLIYAEKEENRNIKSH